MRNTDKAELKAQLAGCHSIAFDGCHKIYLQADETQTNEMLGFGYGEGDSPLVLISSIGEAAAYVAVKHWFDTSCSLRFISKTSTSNGFYTVVAQA